MNDAHKVQDSVKVFDMKYLRRALELGVMDQVRRKVIRER